MKVDNQTYCVVSKELLIFLEWLIHNPQEINKIVSYAWDKGFSTYMDQKDIVHFDDSHMQDIIFQLFAAFECQIKQIKKNEKKREVQLHRLKKQTNADKLDVHYSNPEVLSRIFSTMDIELNTKKVDNSDLKEIFYKKFLEEWDFTDALCH